MNDLLWRLQAVRLGRGAQPRLSDVSLVIQRGITAVVGASGSGKTSLLNILVGYEKPERGTVDCCIQPARERLSYFWAPQDFGLWPHLSACGHLEAVMPTEKSERVEQLLRAFDILDKASSHPAELSQGERARLSIARALAAEPMALVMDEPLAHVDPARVDRFWEVIDGEIKARNMSLVFAAHDPTAVISRADRVVCLDAGRVLYQGDCETLYRQPTTEQLMRFLGHGNWFPAHEAQRWLGHNGVEGCVRPEQIAIEANERGPLVVRTARFAGQVAEAELVHEPSGATRRVFHRPVRHALSVGQRVALRLLTMLLLAVMISGCDDGHAAVLTPTQQPEHWRFPADGPRYPAPRHVSIGPNDQVVVLDNAARVLIYDSEGNLLRPPWRMPESAAGNPEGVCWLKDGRIAVADTHYYRVVIFDDQGNVLSMWGGNRGEQMGQFIYPVSIVQDDKENIYVCEYGGNDRVQVFTPQGELVRSFGKAGTGEGQFQRASGLVWRDGRIYIADAANHRIQAFTDQGQFLAVLGEGELGYPYDVDMGPDGNLYVIEWSNGCVTRMSTDGRIFGRFGQTGSGFGEFLRPWSVAVDSQGRLRVADTGNSRLVALRF